MWLNQEMTGILNIVRLGLSPSAALRERDDMEVNPAEALAVGGN